MSGYYHPRHTKIKWRLGGLGPCTEPCMVYRVLTTKLCQLTYFLPQTFTFDRVTKLLPLSNLIFLLLTALDLT